MPLHEASNRTHADRGSADLTRSMRVKVQGVLQSPAAAAWPLATYSTWGVCRELCGIAEVTIAKVQRLARSSTMRPLLLLEAVRRA